MQNNPDEIETLKATILELREKIAKLEAENAELRRRLGLDSTNSSKPPSSDGYKKKTVAPALPRENHSKGGQEGHKGRTLKRVENPDRIELHLPGQCQCCGRVFNSDDPHDVIQNRQVFDLPEPKLEVTEHRIGQINCCGIEQRGEFPPEVKAPVQYGPGVRTLVAMLSVDHKMPIEQISQLFDDLYGYELNSSTILETLKGAYEQAAPLENANKQQLLEAPIVHFDETGARVAGKLHWVHTASTSDCTHLYVNEKRGQEALQSDDSVLKDYTGTAVHDCWKPYFTFEEATHSLCGAHLIRELKGLEEVGSIWASEMHAFLLALYMMLINPLIAAKELRTIYAQEILDYFDAILGRAELEEPIPDRGQKRRGRVKKTKGRNLLDRLRKHRDGVLAFVLKEGVPFTNNQAERDLRGFKVKLKISGCFRTIEGARIYARIQAVISTFRKRKESVFAKLRELFSPRSATV